MNINERDLKDLNVFLRAIRDAVEGEVAANVESRLNRDYGRRHYLSSQEIVDQEVDEIVHNILESIASEAVIRYRQSTDATDE